MGDVRVGELSDLEESEPVKVEPADGPPICVVRVGDRVYAIADTCSHAEASLSEGECYAEDLEIECPLHGATFNLVTGDAESLPATQPVDTFAVAVRGDGVYVET